LKGTKTSMALSSFARNYGSMMVDDASQRTLGGSLTFSRPLKKGWTGALSFTGEQTNLKGFNSILNGANSTGAFDQLVNHATAMGMNSASAAAYAQGIRNEQLKGGLYATLSPTLYRDTRNNPIDPTKGSFTKITGGPSLGITGSSFVKAGISHSHYKELPHNTTLAMNIQGGSSLGGLPQFAGYRLGGFNGIRGYRAFSDLGTGTGLLMSSVELRHKLPIPKGDKGTFAGMISNYFDKNVKAVAFTDFGGVGGNGAINGAFQRATIAGSIGVGFRVNIPMVGLVRFDYGFPLLSTALGKFTPRFTVGFGDKF
jgi:outer membrane protein assembly factor BamA